MNDADVVNAAFDVQAEMTAGTLSAATLERELLETMRSQFGTVGAGPGDPLWSLHLDVARQFIAAGGLTSGELREWLSVRLRAENGGELPEGSTPTTEPDEAAPVALLGVVEPAPEPDDDLGDLPESVLADAEAAAQAVIDRYRAGLSGVTE
ncbi:hypothetical protein FK529_08790 [Tsukamurella asaccharolytica]|uniref:Flagellar hook-length control protein n=1 Tax=Tsukamurella asaccharolytica TaxID=2592067 RepID=A0A5C5RC32_9ACTN|nr:hypothetical protein [Tsukamurella asaccharolytica]TWS20202.1 hypothetical protein FK529_08790 [Tsukamurella asaccharolytica]